MSFLLGKSWNRLYIHHRDTDMSNLKSPKKIGVVGVGHLGHKHLKNLLKIESDACSGFFDINMDTSKRVAEETNREAFTSLDELIRASDAVVVAVPTSDHFVIGKACLEKKKHIFVEKPLCSTLEEADALIELAASQNRVLQVGHVERLNPAVLTLQEANIPLEPRYIETHRLAPYRVRGTEVPVVLDLMIHDLDVILSLVNTPVKRISATGVSIMTDSVDIANARIWFENGCVANITSSRVAKDYVRKLRLFERDVYITIDFLQGLTEVYKVLDADEEDPGALLSAPLERNGRHRKIVYEKPKHQKINALAVELENFLGAIKGEVQPIVSGDDGREALRLALLIQEKIEQDIG
tara:strand:- start:13446 stop:14507 length:1062 start_codon:yes stop_codon:yes gene_type:complete